MWKLLKVETETEPKCWHCQTNIKYACWIENTESGETICVGRECCANYLNRKQSKVVADKCKTLLKIEKTRNKVYAITEDLSERARLIYLHIGNNELIKKHFPLEYVELIK